MLLCQVKAESFYHTGAENYGNRLVIAIIVGAKTGGGFHVSDFIALSQLWVPTMFNFHRFF